MEYYQLSLITTLKVQTKSLYPLPLLLFTLFPGKAVLRKAVNFKERLRKTHLSHAQVTE